MDPIATSREPILALARLIDVAELVGVERDAVLRATTELMTWSSAALASDALATLCLLDAAVTLAGAVEAHLDRRQPASPPAVLGGRRHGDAGADPFASLACEDLTRVS